MMDDSDHISKMPVIRKGGCLNRLALATAGTVMLAACIPAALPSSIALASTDTPGTTWCGSRAPVLLARQDADIDAVTPAEKDAGLATRSESEADSKTAPADSESDTLKEFTPSEAIEADQGVDFPYDI